LAIGGIGAAPSWGKVGLTTHVSGILPGASGGTNNAFMQFGGPASSLKTFNLPNANDTIACIGQAQTFSQAQIFSATVSVGTTNATAQLVATSATSTVPAGWIHNSHNVAGALGLVASTTNTGATSFPFQVRSNNTTVGGGTALFAVAGDGTSVFTGTLTVQKATAFITVKDTGASGSAALAFIEFRDSLAARAGYVGKGLGSTNDFYVMSETGDVVLGAGSAIKVRVGSTLTIATSITLSGAYFKADATLGFLVNNAADALNLFQVTNAGGILIKQGLSNFANDAAAAAGSIAVNQLYRNGSVVMIRVT
jgi:hypothetical protein